METPSEDQNNIPPVNEVESGIAETITRVMNRFGLDQKFFAEMAGVY